MAFPVKPEDFKSIIVKPEDSFATGLIKVAIRLPIAVFKNIRYMHNADGTFTEKFKQDICNLGCNQ